MMKKKLATAVFLAMIVAILAATNVFGLLNNSNGMAATLVLGQADFTSSTFAVTQTGINNPVSVAVDPTSGKVFVADFNNNRVLRFGSLTTLANGAAAESVLGQVNFTSKVAAATQSGMRSPVGLAVDSAGRLWVADSNNHRVLRFDNASSKTNGANADGVLGQPNFTSYTTATTQSGMYYPDGLAIDSSGRLWVSDEANHRVLRFDAAAFRANGASADGVLGQPNFTSNTATTTQNGMCNPVSVAVDSSGRLWVSDAFNHRVLRFDGAALRANGANADGVLGQPNFTSNTAATTQSGMSVPVGVTVDATGRLYVAERDNNRVLVFTNAAAKANGGNANYVLGQTNFTGGGSSTSASALRSPFFLFYDSAADVLWVADRTNNRVLMYGTPATLTISGNAGVGGAVLSYYDGADKTATADSSGNYSFSVSYNWSGTVTPALAGYIFSPDHRGYSNVKTDQTAQNYTAAANIQTLISKSVGANDGWILESTRTSTKGGTLSVAAPTLRLGDDNLKKQYRSILSFSTGASLPDNAVITNVMLKVKKQGVAGGGNPVTTFQGFMVDVKKGIFGTAALQSADFQSAASKTYGPITTAVVSSWYNIDLTSGNDYINKLATSSGLTQIRLRFKLGDNNNGVANYISLYSGNAPAASRPQLIIEYYVP